ncbi:MAG: protein kinase [Myxococcaceae bacterium]|nr:protein kinase [Myxococcaceae bacterium]
MTSEAIRTEPVRGAPGPGDTLSHFRIVRRVDSGGMGDVFLARDLLLGRPVALKLLRATRVSSESLLREARLTARLAHPNVVTLHEVGAHEGTPFVVLEFVEGETLRDWMSRERPSARAAARVALEIAAACAAAHAAGVVHRDLKPENVLMGSDGRVRVADFGLAAAEEETGAFDGAGTPAYMAPERWLGRDAGAPGDIWSLGVLMHELFVGGHPLGELSSELLRHRVCAPDAVVLTNRPGPEVLRELLARCLAKTPEERPEAADVVATLSGFLNPGLAPTEKGEPFRGLLPFDGRHASTFFGRSAEVAVLVERIRTSASVLVVGASGAGKTSLLQAGVIPALCEKGAWRVLSLRPSAHPLRSLASLLARDPEASALSTLAPGEQAGSASREEGSAMEQDLEEAPARLSVHLGALAERYQSRVLLVVDQLEELFAVTTDTQARKKFLQALCAAADDARGPLRVVLSMREDFLGALAGEPGAAPLLRDLVLVSPPSPAALREILVRTLEGHGYRFSDAALPDEMVSAVSAARAPLPLLSFATHELWERRDERERTLTRAAYEDIGGVAGALTRHAEGLIEALPPSERRTARDVLLRLVTPMRTRRALTRAELLDGLGPGAADVVGRLIDRRLLVSTHTSDDEPAWELAHESLLTHWPRLRAWVDENVEQWPLLEEARGAAEGWLRRGRAAEALWRGDATATARQLLSGGVRLPEAVEEFLRASVRRERHVRWAARGAIGAVVALLSSASLFLAHQVAVAEEQRALASTREAEAVLETARAAVQRGDPLEARARLRTALELAEPRGASSVFFQLANHPLVWRAPLGGAVNAVAYSPDGVSVVATGQSGKVVAVDIATREQRLLAKLDGDAFDVEFAPEGRTIAVGGSGGVHLVSLDGGKVRRLGQHGAPVYHVAYSRDGRLLATSAFDHTVRLWDTRSGASRSLSFERNPLALSFSPDGATLAVGSLGGAIRLVDVSSGRVLHTLEGHTVFGVTALQFTSDGHRLWSSSGDATVREWDVASARELRVITGNRGGLWHVSVSPDEKLLATASVDGTARLWHLESGRELAIFRSSGGDFYRAVFSPDGRLLATAGHDGTFALWKVPELEYGRTHTHRGAVHDTVESGGTVLSAGADGQVLRWSASSGAAIQASRVAEGVLNSLARSPDGRWIATAGADPRVQLLDPVSFARKRAVDALGGSVHGLSFSPDGKRLAVAVATGRVHLVSLVGEGAMESFVAHQGFCSSVAFSPDGRFLATGGADGWAHLWDARTQRQLAQWESPGGGVWAVEFDPRSRWLVLGAERGATVIDLASRARWSLLEGVRVNEVMFDEQGERLAIAAANGEVQLRTTSEWKPTWTARHRREANSVSFINGTLIASSGDDGTVRLWSAADGTPVTPHPRPPEGPSSAAASEPFTSTESGAIVRTATGAQLLLEGTSSESRAGVVRADASGVVFAGFEDGTAGAWNPDTGASLVKEALHGAVIRANVLGDSLRFETELGDHLTLDLRPLRSDRCSMLRTLWETVPFVWREGALVRAPVPGEHPCAGPR